MFSWFTETTREEAIIATFVAAVAWLVETLGPYPAEWEWGAIHTVTFKHPVAMGAKRLSRLLNIGPLPMGGDCNTVNNAYWTLKDPYAVTNGASYRLLVDLAAGIERYGRARVQYGGQFRGHRLAPLPRPDAAVVARALPSPRHRPRRHRCPRPNRPPAPAGKQGVAARNE